jgi:hypothetical protein
MEETRVSILSRWWMIPLVLYKPVYLGNRLQVPLGTPRHLQAHLGSRLTRGSWAIYKRHSSYSNLSLPDHIVGFV